VPGRESNPHSLDHKFGFSTNNATTPPLLFI